MFFLTFDDRIGGGSCGSAANHQQEFLFVGQSIAIRLVVAIPVFERRCSVGRSNTGRFTIDVIGLQAFAFAQPIAEQGGFEWRDGLDRIVAKRFPGVIPLK